MDAIVIEEYFCIKLKEQQKIKFQSKTVFLQVMISK